MKQFLAGLTGLSFCNVFECKAYPAWVKAWLCTAAIFKLAVADHNICPGRLPDLKHQRPQEQSRNYELVRRPHQLLTNWNDSERSKTQKI